MTLSREELEKFLEKVGGCYLEAEKSKYFVLRCSRHALERVRRAIIEELGYPASYGGKKRIVVYREKPPKRVGAVVTYTHVSENVDGVSVSVPKPRICFRGSTYEIRDVLKRWGFGWTGSDWCRNFDSVSQLRSFVENDLPNLVTELAGRGVEVDTTRLGEEWLAPLLEDLRRDVELGMTDAAVFLSSNLTDPRPLIELSKVFNDEETARSLEEITRAWEDFGDAVKLEFIPDPQRGAILACVSPARYLGKDLFKQFVGRARELGMERFGGTWRFCKYVGFFDRAKGSVLRSARNLVLSRLGIEEWNWEKEREWIESALLREPQWKGVKIGKDDVERVADSLWNAISDRLERVREVLAKVLT